MHEFDLKFHVNENFCGIHHNVHSSCLFLNKIKIQEYPKPHASKQDQ